MSVFRLEAHDEIIDRCLMETGDNPDVMALLELFRQVGEEIPQAQDAIFDGLRKWRGGP